MKLQNIDYGTYNLNKTKYVKYICIDNKNKKYKEDTSNEVPISIVNISYINIYDTNYLNTILVTTPIMVCPFGFETNNGYSIKLQFTNYKSDSEMMGFYNFIRNIEFMNMNFIGIKEKDINLYKTQIWESNEKYDPLLLVKVPFINNRFPVNVYHDKYNLNINNIHKFSKVKCDIYIDKIWKYNNKFICKWKLKDMYIY